MCISLCACAFGCACVRALVLLRTFGACVFRAKSFCIVFSWLFAALISLFVTRSALGIGTIIGSEIFNHLCITAGSILYSKGGVLEVDARILARDIVFYFIAILALLYCESDVRQCDSGAEKFVDCDDQWDDEVS